MKENPRKVLCEMNPYAEVSGEANGVQDIGKMLRVQTNDRKLEDCTPPLMLDRSIDSGSWRCVDPRANMSKDSGRCQSPSIQVRGFELLESDTIATYCVLERAWSFLFDLWRNV